MAVLLFSTATLFVAALAVAETFGDEGVVFRVPFLIVDAMQADPVALSSSRGVPGLFLGAASRDAP